MTRSALLVLCAALLGCDADADDPTPEAPMAMSLTSSAFPPDGELPVQYTCDGGEVSPALEWDGLPEGTQSLALVVDDPDAPDPRAPQRTWVHWVVYNLPPAADGIAEGASPGGLPEGAREGTNDFQRPGYGGACPPVGRHRYVHRLYALDTVLPDLGTPTKAELEAAMEGHVLGRAELVGTYERSR